MNTLGLEEVSYYGAISLKASVVFEAAIHPSPAQSLTPSLVHSYHHRSRTLR